MPRLGSRLGVRAILAESSHGRTQLEFLSVNYFLKLSSILTTILFINAFQMIIIIIILLFCYFL
jgi:hypothetical protein